MIKIIKGFALLTLFACLHSVAEPESTNTVLNADQKRHIETSECIAFYTWGEASTKHNKEDYRITNKFKKLKSFLKKKLRLDVGSKAIKTVIQKGRSNFKKHLELHDDKYELKHDEYETELLEVYKHYNPQCKSAITYYQTHNLSTE